MPSINRVQLMGHMTRDAEMRLTPAGKAVTNFGVATNWGSGDKKQTDFHNCVIWDSSDKAPKAQWASKLKQGDLVYVEGRLTTRTWESDDGVKHNRVEIVCDRADLLKSKTDSATKPNQLVEVDPDDIPF